MKTEKGLLKGHLDIYDMNGTEVEWDSNPEVKTEDIKDLLACLYPKEWEQKFKEFEDFEVD